MAPLSEDAAQAIALMPVPVLEQEIDTEKAIKMTLIKYSAGAFAKVSYPAYLIDGSQGLKEIIPHAMHCVQVIRQLPNLNHHQKAQAFIRSLYGGALTDANAAYTECDQGLTNADTGAANPITFEDFVRCYTYKTGHPLSRYNQLEGIRFLSKPTNMPVHRWKIVFFSKNQAVPYCRGNQEQPLSDDTMRQYFFHSFPKRWRDEFTNNGSNNLATVDLQGIMSFMQQQEAKAQAKAAENHAKQMTENAHKSEGRSRKRRTYDSNRPEDSAPGGRNNRFKNQKSRNRIQRSNGDKGKDKSSGEERCRRCAHNHLWKDCFYNPANPKNKLKSLADKSKDMHQHAMQPNADQELPGGFSKENAQPAPSKAEAGEFSPRTNRTVLSDITNTRHALDCFSIQDLESNPDHTIPTSSASKEANIGSSGWQCEMLNPTKSKDCGTSPRKSDANPVDEHRRQKEQEEIRCMFNACEAISSSLFSEDAHAISHISDYHDSKVIAKDFNNESIPLSQHEIKPGADTPMTIMVVARIQVLESKKPLRVLIDSGSKRSFIYKDALPYGCEYTKIEGIKTTLLDQSTIIDKMVQFEDIVLPELSSTHHITQPFQAFVAESEAQSFDVILGQDFNIALGINVINSRRVVQWNEFETPFRVVPSRNKRFREMQQAYIDSFSPQEEEYEPRQSHNNCFAAEILSARYDKASTDEVADNQLHLTPKQRQELKLLLRQFPKLFSGKLGLYPGRKIHLDVDKDAIP